MCFTRGELQFAFTGQQMGGSRKEEWCQYGPPQFCDDYMVATVVCVAQALPPPAGLPRVVGSADCGRRHQGHGLPQVLQHGECTVAHGREIHITPHSTVAKRHKLSYCHTWVQLSKRRASYTDELLLDNLDPECWAFCAIFFLFAGGNHNHADMHTGCREPPQVSATCPVAR